MAKKNSAVRYLNTVNMFSIIVAAFIFFFFLLGAFLIGIKYQQQVDLQLGIVQTQR